MTYGLLLPTLEWQKASICGSSTCVEVALTPDFVAVRDSKDLERPALIYSTDEWAAFLTAVKAGEFDLPTA
ncbi:DUF397 domain-containing protein [Jidongwangia harbinensis]|uniref:DUF397 domain-containing protein n=1 Tax=Jidongwangia harbinensis TaxID=2878561 RepID=UPI001CDA0277|nr:DUF397 domain-containing protein [Jidongwangia harbinensis]MCA2213386.1 DUF397 domain-containing protein [Jidongwangia harbinensis]